MTLAEIARTRGFSRDRMLICAAMFTAASFLSALLLFCLEPMFSKMVLPVLGGSSAVWSIAMAVFQGLLLAGYVYAWAITTFLPLRAATLTHLGVLIATGFCLPVAIAAGFDTPPEQGISLWLVTLFLASVGLPFFAVAANAPLLQAWFARTAHKDAANPYFLYRASNLGSFAVLLAYPFFIEPVWGLSAQSRIWTMGFGLLALCIAACGALALSMPKEITASQPIAAAETDWRTRLYWIVLGFVPSGLLVAVTAHISTDVASAPFLWIAPLALYLLTFVLAFTDKPVIRLEWLLAAQPVSIALLAVLFLWDPAFNWSVSLGGHLAAFFIAAMICQTLLYRSRPEAASLTQFYAWMSLGGVLGGIFAAIVAPQIFNSVLEYPILMVAAFALRPDVRANFKSAWLKDAALVLAGTLVAAAIYFIVNARSAETGLQFYAVVAIGAAAALPFLVRRPVRLLGLATVLVLVTGLFPPGQDIVYRARSFFGVYKILTRDSGTYHLFFHGTTTHGAEQMLGTDGKPLTGTPEPLAYYYRGGGLGAAIEKVRTHQSVKRVAVVGLGIGALSCYVRPTESWTFYELDPLVVRIARDRTLFRSFSACAANSPVVIGDARLTLHKSAPGLDLLVLDAFTSDSVPVHLLTKEAFALYRAKLSPHGIIVFHISNRNLELSDVVASSAAANGMVAALHPRPSSSALPYRFPSEVAIVAQSQKDLTALHLGAEWRPLAPHGKTWTDDYSDVLGALMERLAR